MASACENYARLFAQSRIGPKLLSSRADKRIFGSFGEGLENGKKFGGSNALVPSVPFRQRTCRLIGRKPICKQTKGKEGKHAWSLHASRLPTQNGAAPIVSSSVQYVHACALRCYISATKNPKRGKRRGSLSRNNEPDGTRFPTHPRHEIPSVSFTLALSFLFA